MATKFIVWLKKKSIPPHCSLATTSNQCFTQFSLTSFNLFTHISIPIDAQCFESRTVAPFTKPSFLFLLEWDEPSSETAWWVVWACLTVSILFRGREGEREDAAAEEKGGPEQLSNDVAWLSCQSNLKLTLWLTKSLENPHSTFASSTDIFLSIRIFWFSFGTNKVPSLQHKTDLH